MCLCVLGFVKEGGRQTVHSKKIKNPGHILAGTLLSPPVGIVSCLTHPRGLMPLQALAYLTVALQS